MIEQRGGRRRRFLRGAKIVPHAGVAALDCVVWDLSATGARLRMASADGLPDEFRLDIALDRSSHQCRIVWRSANEIGVTFLSGAAACDAEARQVSSIGF